MPKVQDSKLRHTASCKSESGTGKLGPSIFFQNRSVCTRRFELWVLLILLFACVQSLQLVHSVQCALSTVANVWFCED